MPETTTNLNAFDAKNFNCDNYVKELVNECVGGSELQQRKQKIQSYSDQTSSTLKKHVYDNYMQFIETAKEISHLESEMYQLSHLLIEQRNTLQTLRDESLTDDQKTQIIEEDETAESTVDKQNKRAIDAIKESLINYPDNLDEKIFIHEGGLIELDSDSYRPICRVHLFLFNDLLIIAKIKHDKKLEYNLQYDAKKLAVINIRDLDGVKNAINVITPDGAKIFQCISPKTKNEWIEKFEIAIKYQAAASSSSTISGGGGTASGTPNIKSTKKNPAPQPPTISKIPKSQSDLKSMASSDFTMSPDSASITSSMTGFVQINWGPDWLITAPEEILALIAQRHFDETLQLITECEEHFAKDSQFYGATELSVKIKELKMQLSSVLLLELSKCQSRSLHAALRSSRRPLKLLAKMGKAREACGTLLRVCSSAIRTSQRQARRNNFAISELFFCDLAHVAIEFMKAFNQQAACISTLVVWCNSELQYFASQLIKHYLNKGTHLEDVAKCVEGVRKPCAQLTDIGLDLSYHMEGLLRNSLEQIIEESRLRLVETIGRTEEIWQPYNLQTKTKLRETLLDMDAMGIDMKSQVTGDTWINLTQSTVNFCRHFLSVTESCGYLAKNETLKQNVELLLKDLFLAQHSIKPSPSITVDLNFVARNKNYLSDVLLPIAISKFQNFSNGKCELLNEVAMQIQQQKNPPPKPKPRSIYKTELF